MQGQCNLPAAAIVLLMLAYSALAAPRDYPYAESPPRTILTTDGQAFLSSIQNGLMQELPAENKPTKQKGTYNFECFLFTRKKIGSNIYVCVKLLFSGQFVYKL